MPRPSPKATRARIWTLPTLVLVLFAGPAAGQCLEQKIESPRPIEGAEFGHGVWLEGETLVAGGHGGLHVFEQVDGRWAFDHTIDLAGGRGPTDWIDWTDFDGQRVIAGGNDEAFIYARDGDRFVVEQRLPAPDPAFRSFGETVAIEGDTAIAGQRGYLWVYRLEADGWRQVQFLDYPRGLGLDRYGYWLELQDGWRMVSAHQTDAGDVNRAGAVVAFPQQTDGTFGDPQVLSVDVPREIEEISKPVLRNGVLAVTSRGEDERDGTQIVAHTFRLRGDAWVYDQAVRGSLLGDLYWSTVQLGPEGDTLLVGAPDGRGLYSFERDAEGMFAEVVRIDDGQGAGALFGGLATDGRTAFAGSPAFRVDDVFGVGAVAIIDALCERCTADLTGDGRADTNDLLAFLNLYERSDPMADFDGDGAITPQDLDAFQIALDAGCPPLPTGCDPRIAETVDDLGLVGDVVVEGDVAYAHSATLGFLVLDVRDPTRPAVLGSLPASSFAGEIALRGSTAYFSGPASELVIADVSELGQPRVLNTIEHPDGFFNPVASGDLIAVRNGSRRTVAYDVTDPMAPFLIGELGGNDIAGRDGFFFVAGGYELTDGWMTVADERLDVLGRFDLIGEGLSVTLSDNGTTAYASSWNFRGGAPVGNFLAAFDVTDPERTTELGVVAGGSRFTMLERNGYVYASDRSGVYAYDVRDPRDMQLAYFVPTPCRDIALIGHNLWAFGDDGNVYVIDIATCLPCRADLDGDGRATVYDVLDFLRLYEAADPSADFNQDGRLSIVDLLGFQRAVDAGCG